MEEWPEVRPNGTEPRLDDRVLELLSARSSTLAFNGLRRALGAHPESLSRALRRLERAGVIRRESGGYSLALREDRSGTNSSGPETRTVATVALPPGISGEELLGRLAGSWFGSLRWVGVYDRPNDPWLAWSTPSNEGHVLLSVRDGSLRVLLDRPSSSPRSDELEGAATELLVRALERVRPSGGGAGASPAALLRHDEANGFSRLWDPWHHSGLGLDMEGTHGPSAS